MDRMLIAELVAGGYIVKQYYMMDPETETLVRGHDLRNGMRVLVESPVVKSDLSPSELTDNEQGYRKMLKYNRWSTVTKLEYDSNTGRISFIGRYYDGTEITIQFDLETNWYVKKDSIPKEEARLSTFGVNFRSVPLTGDHRADAETIINTLEQMGVPFSDDPGEKTEEIKIDPLDQNQKEVWVDPNAELTDSDEPAWVKQIDDRWAGEKGTSTKL